MESSVWNRDVIQLKSTKNGKKSNHKKVVEESPSFVIGIDFGTSNSCVGLWRIDKDRVKIVKNTKGK
jgi:molecular chaperone DnaK (HSP70)